MIKSSQFNLKKMITIILVISTLIACIPMFAITSYAYSTGDVNNDKKINAIDSALLLSSILGKSVPDLVSMKGDINHDGKINSIDLSLIISTILGNYVISQ